MSRIEQYIAPLFAQIYVRLDTLFAQIYVRLDTLFAQIYVRLDTLFAQIYVRHDTLFAQIYVRLDILLACGKHHNISLKGGWIWAHKTSKRSCICVLVISISPLSTVIDYIWQLFPTVW
jgi:hypothetical protein